MGMLAVGEVHFEGGCMICPECNHPEGIYSEIEDFNPGNDVEWSYSVRWCCLNCSHFVSDYEDDFEYEEEEQ